MFLLYRPISLRCHTHTHTNFRKEIRHGKAEGPRVSTRVNSYEASTLSIVSWGLSSLTSQLGDTFFSNWGCYHNWHSGTCSVSTLRAQLAKLVLIEHMTSLFIRVTMLAFISFILYIWLYLQIKLIQHVYINVYRSWFSQPLCCVSRQLDDYASVYEAGCKLDTETWTRKRREAEIPDQVAFDVEIVTKEKSMMKKSSKRVGLKNRFSSQKNATRK